MKLIHLFLTTLLFLIEISAQQLTSPSSESENEPKEEMRPCVVS
jgi:hypothetical protein